DTCINLVWHTVTSTNLAGHVSRLIEKKMSDHLKFHIKRAKSFSTELLINRIRNILRRKKRFNYLYTDAARDIVKHEIYRNMFVLKDLGINTLPQQADLPKLYNLNTKSVILNNELRSTIAKDKINLIMHP